MTDRLAMQYFLENLDDTVTVYFQPPSNINLQYPAIIYSMKQLNVRYANNIPYTGTPVYEIIVIDKNPDNDIVKQLMLTPKCLFDRCYVSDNLMHSVFNLYI